jgi:hypothetical protein
MGIALGLLGCGETLDAGSTRPHGLLPVDERNPMILSNDGSSDNWQGEYAVLLANRGGASLAGMIVNSSAAWPNLTDNVADWRGLVAAARASGLRNIPDPIASIGPRLSRPSTGIIEDTLANRSEGALLIVNESARLSLPYRPTVVVTGGRLTDVADAYLIDPTVAERIVVVSSLGTLSAAGAAMGNPNGEMDPWADSIVTARFRYVQVSAFYDQLLDVPNTRLSDLPANAFGAWIAAKQPDIYDLQEAADQVAVVAVGLPRFTLAIDQVAAPESAGAEATAGPDLARSNKGNAWLVTRDDGALATAWFWEALLDPSTFAH